VIGDLRFDLRVQNCDEDCGEDSAGSRAEATEDCFVFLSSVNVEWDAQKKQ